MRQKANKGNLVHLAKRIKGQKWRQAIKSIKKFLKTKSELEAQNLQLMLPNVMMGQEHCGFIS